MSPFEISNHRIDKKYQAWFQFESFNAIQERCIPDVLDNVENAVISSPTGSGKTTIFELAMIKSLQQQSACKIVYLSPMRALCAEKFSLWAPKMKLIGKTCLEMIGGTESTEKELESASLVVTTPEKMDFLTRTGNFISQIGLILIDEVHTLNDSRGAVLEALISRIRLMANESGHYCRIVAVSATIPNIENLGTWLRSLTSLKTAKVLSFPDSMRPVPLKTHVMAYPMNGKNGFKFDFSLNYKLSEIISRHSENKPSLIFCSTRKSTIKTADFISMNRPKSEVALNENIALEDPHLLEMVVSSGVAYHHAGLSASDRELIESLFRNNKISVLCSTSTLAIGVNLPAHLVIIKSTLQYTESGYSEYSDLDIRQMMGRAGRAGFDTNGVAVILTSTDTEHLYKSISEGKVEIESKLLQSFNEFLSVEVTNGKITSLDQALKWFSYTFLYVRMRLNPKRFSLKTTEPFDYQIKTSIDLYLNELAQSGIIEYDGSDIRITKLGHAMARNFIKFKSVKDLSKSTLKNVVEMSDLLRVICQSTEAVIEVRSGDKTLLHKIASDPRLAFPIAGKSNYWESWKKHFLLIQISLQSELVEFEEKLTPIQRSDQHSILESSIRVVKFISEMAIQWNSAILLRNCLELVSSLTGSAWHSNPKIHQQIPGIGIISAKTLFSAGIKSISSLKEVDDTRIELLLKRNPPFGRNLKKQLNLQFPNIDLNCNILDLEDRKMSIDIPRIEKFGNSCKYLVHLLAIAYDSSSSKGRILLYEKISLSHLEKVSFSRSISLKGFPEKSFSCSLMFENWAGLNQNVCFDIEGAPKIPKTEEIDSEVKAPCLIENQRQIIAESESKINQLNSDHDYNIESPISTSNYDFQYTSPSPKHKIPISPQSNASTPISCKHKCKDRLGCAHPCCKKGLLTHNSPKDQNIVRKPQFMAGAKRSLTNAREYLRKYQPIPASTNFTNCLIPQAVKKKSEEDENVLYDEIEFVLRSIE